MKISLQSFYRSDAYDNFEEGNQMRKEVSQVLSAISRVRTMDGQNLFTN